MINPAQGLRKPKDNGRLGLWLVPNDPAALTFVETQDGGHCAEWRVDLSGAESLSTDIGETIAALMDGAVLATSAYLLGQSERCFDITLDYMRTRQQFDRFLGSFQSLQHRLADQKIQLALSRASIESAAEQHRQDRDVEQHRAPKCPQLFLPIEDPHVITRRWRAIAAEMPPGPPPTIATRRPRDPFRSAISSFLNRSNGLPCLFGFGVHAHSLAERQ